MKLSNLKEITIVEVVQGPNQQIGLKDPSLLNNLRDTGRNIEGYNLFALQINDEIVFALKQGEMILTVLVGTLITNFPNDQLKTIRVGRSWTPEEFRNKGFSTALYDGLPRNGYRVVSDEQLSDAAISVWKKLGTKRKLKAFDWETGQYTDKDPLTNPRVSFILEFTGYTHKSTILKESVLFTAVNN